MGQPSFPRLVAVLVVGLVAPAGTVGAQVVVDAPASITFAAADIGACAPDQAVTMRVVSPSNPDGHLNVVGAGWQGGAGSPFQLKTALPVSAPGGSPITLSVGFCPQAVPRVGDELTIAWAFEGSPATPQSTLAIAFSGAGRCSNPMNLIRPCDPPGPLCVIDLNTMPFVAIGVQDFGARVAPAIRRHNDTHRAASGEYRLPLSVLWQVLGVSDYLPTVSDCDVNEIVFKRVLGTWDVATFEWNQRPGSPLPELKGDKRPLAYLSVQLPARLSGHVVLHGTLVEYWFDSGFEPGLTYEQEGARWFEGQIPCFNANAAQSVVRNARYAGPATAIPHQHLRLGP